nr:MAG TPA: Flavinator of succinate dehydrogenase [Microviridae sp.]
MGGSNTIFRNSNQSTWRNRKRYQCRRGHLQ